MNQKIAKEKNNILDHEPLPHISLFDNINQIAYVADPKTHKVLYVNNFFQELLGQNPIGKKCYEVFQNLSHPCDFCTNKIILKDKGKPYEWEYHNSVLDKDFLVTDQIIRWHDGRDVRFEFAIDITNIKKSEKKIKESEERFKMAQKAADIGSWDWDIKTGKLVWSDEIESIFGLKKDEFKGTYEDFLKLVYPDDREFLQKKIDDCLNKNEEYDVEHRIIKPDGTVCWLREKGDVVRNENNEPVRMLGIVQDITERKRSEDKIRDITRKYMFQAKMLSEANKELEAFSYSVSHDLRAPLRSINGFSQALIEDYEDILDKEGKDYLLRIKKSADRMAELMDGLLKLSRLIRKEINFETINLGEIAETVINDLKKNIKDRKVKFNIINKENMYVKGDPNLFKILFENLIGNSLKFTEKKPKAEITVGVKKDDSQREVFYVKDNGVGFDMQYSDKLFIPFQRLHKEKEFSGTGIGLSIVKRIIKRHDGKIWAEGKKGTGSTFYFIVGE